MLVDNLLIFTCDGDREPKIVALDADELVEVTPSAVRVRKRVLANNMRSNKRKTPKG